MESIIVLIVLIILFNLFSTLLRAARGKKSAPSPKTVPGRNRIDRPEFAEPSEASEAAEGYSPVGRTDVLREEADASSFYGQWVSEQETDEPAEEDYSEKPGEELFPAEKEQFPEDELPREKLPVKGVRQTQPLAVGLRQVLADRDSLVAAFIFHELIGPPVSRRKRR